MFLRDWRGNWPQIWRIARQEVALQIFYPIKSGKLRGGGDLTTGSLIVFFPKFINAAVDSRGSLASVYWFSKSCSVCENVHMLLLENIKC